MDTSSKTPPGPRPSCSRVWLFLRSNSDAINVVVASYLSWMLDAFDFFVLVFVLSKAATEFGVLLSQMTLTITVTLLCRPLGAVIFGLAADRYGRRRPMMVNLVFFSVMEVLSGFAPGFTSFMVCRAVFGIGMGGVWGVGSAILMEKVAPRWRGLFSGLLQQGYPSGYLLAACCFRFLPASWSWRSLFFIGGLPALLAVFVRYRVKESETWQRSGQHRWSDMWQAVVRNWKMLLYLTLLMTLMNFASHGTQDLYPSFLELQRHLTKTQVADIVILSNIGAILGGVAFGFFSDRRGRRCGMAVAFILAAFLVPLWASGSTTGLLSLGGFLMQFMVQGAWGIIPAHINELSPDAVRGFLPGFAYQCGVLIAANSAHFEAEFAKHGTYSSTMAITALIVFFVGTIVIVCGPERRSATFGAGQATAAGPSY